MNATAPDPHLRNVKNGNGFLTNVTATTTLNRRRARRCLSSDEAWDRWLGNRDEVARDWLLEHHRDVVDRIVSAYSRTLPRWLSRADLTAFGMIGLLDALDKFNPAFGYKFNTYATHRVRGAIVDGVRELDWTGRCGRGRSANIDSATEVLAQRHGRAPTDDEVAEHLGLSAREMERWQASIVKVRLTDFQPHDSRDDGYYVPASDSAEREAMRSVDAEWLNDEIRQLPPIERRIVREYWFGERLLGDIADDYGLTESRISQLKTKATNRLRARMTSQLAAA